MGTYASNLTEENGSPQIDRASDNTEYTSYTEPRYGYTVTYPANWILGGSFKGDFLEVTPTGGTSSPGEDPSIRVLIEETNLERGQNLKPANKATLGGPEGQWVVTETTFSTNIGWQPGYILSGNIDEYGVRHRMLGLYVYGSGHSVTMYCSAPQPFWPQFESVCQKAVDNFTAGDTSMARPLFGMKLP